MARSRFDDLHDRYHQLLTTKAGTRYERLAALVWKALNDRDAVVHDLKLLGDSHVSHQIDVIIQQAGADRRVLIECKDYDLAGATGGLDVIRSFRSVLEDTGADEGVVLTSQGFTRDALQYAKAKNIKLLVLRIFEPRDMEGRVQKIVLTLQVRMIVDIAVHGIGMRDADREAFAAQLTAAGLHEGIHLDSPVFFVKDGERVQFNEHLRVAASRLSDGLDAGRHTARMDAGGWELAVNEHPPVPFEHIDLEFELQTESLVSEIASERIAEMLLQGFGTADIIIFGDQLERRRIDAEGEVL